MTTLSARLALLTLAAGLTGCVVPVGPKFEERSNSPPYVVTADPPLGTLTAVPRMTIQFGDADVENTLYVQVLADYPPYSGDSRLFLSVEQPGGTRPERNPISIEPDCALHSLAPGIEVHQIHVAVSDRPFRPVAELTPDQLDWRFTQPAQGAGWLQTQWLLRLDCAR